VKIDFEHRQYAHCESGAAANLLRHYGHDLSEAMIFGIGSGYFFGYLPFIRLNKLPLTTFRRGPGAILKQMAKRLHLEFNRQKFTSEDVAVKALNDYLDAGVPVGAQTGVYWLPYFPPALRFHFNAHNLVVYGREGDDYLISDPIGEAVVRCARDDLLRARFARGPLAPKGCIYTLEKVPEKLDLPVAIRAGIKDVTGVMLAPMPLIGVRGIRFLAGQVESWPRRFGDRRAALYLGQLIRMQEEIGTGGGGFRFIFAAFLQESADILGDEALREFSVEMLAIGDRWREFAVLGARCCKGRGEGAETYRQMAAIIRDCGSREAAFFRRMKVWLKG